MQSRVRLDLAVGSELAAKFNSGKGSREGGRRDENRSFSLLGRPAALVVPNHVLRVILSLRAIAGQQLRGGRRRTYLLGHAVDDAADFPVE